MDNAPRYPIGMFLTNLAREQYEPLLRQRGQDAQEIDLPYICLFINTGRELVLVDTGIGVDGMGPAPLCLWNARPLLLSSAIKTDNFLFTADLTNQLLSTVL